MEVISREGVKHENKHTPFTHTHTQTHTHTHTHRAALILYPKITGTFDGLKSLT